MTAKDIKGKARVGLVPRSALEAIARVREFGIKKYQDDEAWKDVDPVYFIEATIRHLYKHLEGMYKDPESGLPHLHHAITSLALAVGAEESQELDDKALSALAEERLNEKKQAGTYDIFGADDSPSLGTQNDEDPYRVERQYRYVDSQWKVL